MQIARAEVNGVLTYGILQPDGLLYDLPRMLRTVREMRSQVGDDPRTMLDTAMDGSRLTEAFLDAKNELQKHGLLTRFTLPANARLLAPIPRPNRILAIGRNYAEHAKEQGASVFEEPIVFLKASTSVIGSEAPIVIPSWIGRVDFESELLVVLGKGGKNVREEDAMSLVAGYTVFNDVTARTQQRAAQERKHPWFLSKSLDTFGPMGPYLVTADEVPEPHALRITCKVNGEIKQDDTTASMVFSIPTLIAFLSKWFVLEAGDVIATGTPSGISPIVPGDVVECEVEGIGLLRNPVIAEEG
jgi:5-oxopent-3-ene-1,2,5-tricarboxylate decarboxylase/2-hydroxyhepta-2,4-diene-1,7-dioate isomerase